MVSKSISETVRPRTLKDELNTLAAVLFNTDRELWDILFYSSQEQYISYYEGLLCQLAEDEQKKVIYLSSDRRDSVFNAMRQNVITYYSESFLSFVFPAIDSSVVVTTIPDLHQYKIKRSFSGTNYVYVFHSLVSAHMMYRYGAFDYFDTVFCTGPHHIAELRRMEDLYNLPPKTLHEVGYYRLEKIYQEHRDYLENQHDGEARKLVLVATGWHNANILNTCADELIKSLLFEGFRVVLRPHPMTIAKAPDLINKYKAEYSNEPQFSIDTTITSEKYLHEADVMICDWSGVALEYALGTERPVLFVDLPRKIHNDEYEKLGINPLEVRIRDQIGKSISPDMVKDAGKIVSDFINRKQEYREKIIDVRQATVFNFGNSSKVGSDIILDILSKGIKGRSS